MNATLIPSAPPAPAPDTANELVWHDLLRPPLEGQGWCEVEAPSDRLPARARTAVPEAVWNLSRHACGLSVRFRTDADALHARWTLTTDVGPSPRWTRLRSSGLDCYGKSSDGRWLWVGAGVPVAYGVEQTARLSATSLDAGWREYRLYLPLGTGLAALRVGVPAAARFEVCGRDTRPPVVCYGTSIVHAATVSRPGMAHVAMLERWMDWPWMNLGFSGNARMEPALAELLSELEARLYVIDCLPNMSAALVAERLPRFVELVRAQRPATPMLFVGDRLFGDAAFQSGRHGTQADKSQVQRETLAALRTRGVPGLHLLDAANFFGDDFDGTVDGSHPNDLGSHRMAVALHAAVRAIVGP